MSYVCAVCGDISLNQACPQHANAVKSVVVWNTPQQQPRSSIKSTTHKAFVHSDGTLQDSIEQGEFSFMCGQAMPVEAELQSHECCHPLERFASHYDEHREGEAADLDPNPMYQRDLVFDGSPDDLEASPLDRPVYDIWGLRMPTGRRDWVSNPLGLKRMSNVRQPTGGRDRIDFEDLYKLGGRVIGRHDAVVDMPWYLTQQFVSKKLKCSPQEASELIDALKALDADKDVVLDAIEHAKGNGIQFSIAYYLELSQQMTSADDALETLPPSIGDLEKARANYFLMSKLRYKADSPVTEELLWDYRRKLALLESAVVSLRRRPDYRDLDVQSRSYLAADDAMEHRNTEGFAHVEDYGTCDTSAEWAMLLEEGVPSAAVIANKLQISLARAGEVREDMLVHEIESAALTAEAAVEDSTDDEEFEIDDDDKDSVGFVSEGWHLMDELDDYGPSWLDRQPKQVRDLYKQAQRSTSLKALKALGQKVYGLTSWSQSQRTAFWSAWHARRNSILSQTESRIAKVRKGVQRMMSIEPAELPHIGKKLFNLTKTNPDFYSPEGWAVIWNQYKSSKGKLQAKPSIDRHELVTEWLHVHAG